MPAKHSLLCIDTCHSGTVCAVDTLITYRSGTMPMYHRYWSFQVLTSSLMCQKAVDDGLFASAIAETLEKAWAEKRPNFPSRYHEGVAQVRNKLRVMHAQIYPQYALCMGTPYRSCIRHIHRIPNHNMYLPLHGGYGAPCTVPQEKNHETWFFYGLHLKKVVMDCYV